VGRGVGQFMTIGDAAVDSKGFVYVVDAGNKRVQKFDSNGTFITKWGSEGKGDGQFDYQPALQ
jgi:tripartite motif-containing protein 71